MGYILPLYFVHFTDFDFHSLLQGVYMKDDPMLSSADTDIKDFTVSLKKTLNAFRRDGRRGVWLRVATPALHLLSAAVDLGFKPHHADTGYVMLTAWIPENQDNKVKNIVLSIAGICL